MNVSDLIVHPFKIEYRQMSHSELYLSSSEPLEQNPLGRVSFRIQNQEGCVLIQELNSYMAVTAHHMAKAPSSL